MNINIKKGEPAPEMLRKEKLSKLENKDEIVHNNTLLYHWRITPENKNESMEDFHLFCISITKELLSHKFKTNERGTISYDVDNVKAEDALKTLHDLHLTILNVKEKK
jgi:hypothetical protein